MIDLTGTAQVFLVVGIEAVRACLWHGGEVSRVLQLAAAAVAPDRVEPRQSRGPAAWAGEEDEEEHAGKNAERAQRLAEEAARQATAPPFACVLIYRGHRSFLGLGNLRCHCVRRPVKLTGLSTAGKSPPRVPSR